MAEDSPQIFLQAKADGQNGIHIIEDIVAHCRTNIVIVIISAFQMHVLNPSLVHVRGSKC